MGEIIQVLTQSLNLEELGNKNTYIFMVGVRCVADWNLLGLRWAKSLLFYNRRLKPRCKKGNLHHKHSDGVSKMCDHFSGGFVKFTPESTEKWTPMEMFSSFMWTDVKVTEKPELNT